MFDLSQTFNVLEILDPATVTGAEYFNWFFTLLMIWGLFCFTIKALVRLLTRS
ncbi:hypothetical protein Dpo_22c00090 [Desulfotignum phosphitoxidans DSM 13687]|jgi:hypothetical protein|uniref:Uncharacterized protein n=1 Tax=Desulfotignum phosphitoxidans DSM 13687 TaxID=1286635 RepID=S0FR95_9BACT|nr:hypothetical protein Dpo_22c00090 [Desulfotignum phosphitoxidans DSM 13687]